MTRLVALEMAHHPLHAGQDAALLEDRVVDVIAGLGQDALDDHVVGGRGAGLRQRRGVMLQTRHGSRQLAVEDPPPGRRVIAAEIAALVRHLYKEPAEGLDVLGLFPQEGGQVDLLLQAAFAGDDPDQGQQLTGHRLLAGTEQSRQTQQQIALCGRQPAPVLAVPGEVDAARIPDSEALRLLPQLHRQRSEIDAGGAGAAEHQGSAADPLRGRGRGGGRRHGRLQPPGGRDQLLGGGGERRQAGDRPLDQLQPAAQQSQDRRGAAGQHPTPGGPRAGDDEDRFPAVASPGRPRLAAAAVGEIEADGGGDGSRCRIGVPLEHQSPLPAGCGPPEVRVALELTAESRSPLRAEGLGAWRCRCRVAHPGRMISQFALRRQAAPAPRRNGPGAHRRLV